MTVALAAPDLFGGGKVAGAIMFQPCLVLRETREFGVIGSRFLADQLVDRKCRVLALDLDPVEFAQQKTVADRRRRVWSNDDAAAVILGHTLEPCGDVHGFTDRRVIVAFGRADIADHPRPAVEADLDRIARHAAPVGRLAPAATSRVSATKTGSPKLSVCLPPSLSPMHCPNMASTAPACGPAAAAPRPPIRLRTMPMAAIA